MDIKVPKSEKPYLGLFMAEGLNTALGRACTNLEMTRSEFVRYCIMRTLQDLSLISDQIKGADLDGH